ncbi:di-heme-cytochrome C peroxidase [Pseudomonas fluorescens]|uniref:di-heme-cytochrome C peroxidase n=1 Tax=Pseudomonas fluorescens TaxID=294 RepID=UPI0007D0B78F|nr:di-heme-cytochrome C peroxidase [Pseudomonas fluorescens]
MTLKSVLVAASIGAGSLISAAVLANDYTLDQNWSAKDLAVWRDTSQGSRLLPLSWITALEIKGSKVPFMSDANVQTYGYTPSTLVFAYQSYRLPRGFVVDKESDKALTFSRLRWKDGQSDQEPWVGMNCAACHTANVSFDGYTWEIPGGPTNADFQKFLHAFREALSDTQNDKEKFDRFASKVLAGTDTQANRQLLSTALDTLNRFLEEGASLNHTDLVYGPGRVDAVGHILNRVAQLNGAPQPTPNPSDAPVSYPFLWNTPQHDKVQWNGVAPNLKLGSNGLDIGALARNASEVVGVFGDVSFRSDTHFKGFPSSVRIDNLDQLERTLTRLKPPKWPEKLGGIDENKQKRGAELFAQNCSSCHLPLPRDDLKAKIVAKMSTISAETETNRSITTDPWMACNAVQFISDPGKLRGIHLNKIFGEITDQSTLVTQLGVTAREILLNQKHDIVALALKDFMNVEPAPSRVIRKGTFGFLRAFQSERSRRLQACYALAQDKKKYPTLAYKARPLTGIWATAPYLHNGSVRTLYDLLLPPDKRPSSFKTGSIMFDPEKVGFVDAFGPGSPFTFDTSLPGNSNAGHDYGASSFLDADRYALIEYMKTL